MEHLFAVDRSLGTLAKWLRILGYDTIYEPEVSAGEFYDRSEVPRILITRSKEIQKAWGSHDHVFISSNPLVEQLQQVVAQIGITREDIRPFSRCIHCNLAIDKINKNEVYGLVPDYIWETHDAFNCCNQCKRIYWSGSHAERSMDMIKMIFDVK
jgi:uncharacterized protein with PIN domain